MSSQIFKTPIPKDMLFNLLESIAVKTEKYYIFDNNSFKKGLFHNLLQEFLEECKPHYHISKRKYVEKNISYNTFVTVVRQICNFNDIQYTSQIKYDKSNYDIIYNIYFE
jgi:hypothetical protein